MHMGSATLDMPAAAPSKGHTPADTLNISAVWLTQVLQEHS